MTRRRTKRSLAIITPAILLLVLVAACTEEPKSECTGLGTTPGYEEVSAASSPETAQCERYARAAKRIVAGWYRSEPEPKRNPLVLDALQPMTASTSGVTVESTCAPSELNLNLDLPATDDAKRSASQALADIVAALPARGLDPSADEMKIVVTLASAGDVAKLDPTERAPTASVQSSR
jgi:hypothetical protein